MNRTPTDARLDDLNAKVDAGFERLDAKIDAGLTRVDTEIQGVRSEIQGVRSEIQGVRSEIQGVRSETNQSIGDLRTGFDRRLQAFERNMWIGGISILAAVIGTGALG